MIRSWQEPKHLLTHCQSIQTIHELALQEVTQSYQFCNHVFISFCSEANRAAAEEVCQLLHNSSQPGPQHQLSKEETGTVGS